MGRVGCQIEKEGPIPPGRMIEEVQSVRGKDIGDVISIAVAMTDDLAVHVQSVVEAVVGVVIDPGNPEVPTRRYVAALLARRRVTVEVFADECGLVTCCMELGCDRIGFVPGFVNPASSPVLRRTP